MKIRYVVVAILLVLLVLMSLVTYAWFTRPKIINVHPDVGAGDVSVTSQVRIEFSQPMNHVSVIEHLTIEPAQEGEYSWDENVLIFTPDKGWPGGKEIRINLEEGAKSASWLAFPMRGKDWSFTIREAYLAYLWPSDGQADIYALNPKLGEIHQYTNKMGVLEFTASKDGTKIYFSANNAKGGSDLYQINLIEEKNAPDNRYKPRRLLDCGSSQCRSPAVSVNGENLAYEFLIPSMEGDLGPAQIWLLDLVDLRTKPIGKVTHETVQPAWSSTGWLAYYDRTSQFYEVIDPQTQEIIQLLNQTGQPGSWSPDGEYYLAPEMMYYPSTEDTETGISHLFRYAVKEETSGDISKADNVEDVEGIYSPEGVSIVFARKYLDMKRWSFGRQIWVMNYDGSNPHPITDEPDFNHYDLAWSRDSHTIAYVRFDEAKKYEPPELWMIGADGRDQIQLVIGGYSPVWLP